VPNRQRPFAAQARLNGDFKGENNDNNMEQPSHMDDMDQDDYDAIQELQTLRQYDRLEDSSYSRFEVEGLREQIAAKKKELHKQFWAAEQRQRQRQRIEVAGNNGLFSRQNTVSFTTVTDPTAQHLAECEAHCHAALSCGTETAPEYHGIQQFVFPGYAS
jgi:hypothetical protein